MTGSDSRQVQQVVDEREEMATAAGDGVQRVSAGRVCQGTFADQIGVAEDGVEGCAQLVAHAGKELVLGAIGCLSLSARGQQRPPLFIELGDPEHRSEENSREDGQRCPDRSVVDLALITYRQPFLRDLPLFFVAYVRQYLVEYADQFRPVFAHCDRESSRLQHLLHRRCDLQITDLVKADVVYDRKNVIQEAVRLAGRNRHEPFEQIGVSGDAVVGIGTGRQLLRGMALDHTDPLGRQVTQSGDEAEVVAGDDHVHVVQIGLGEQQMLFSFRGRYQCQHYVDLAFLQLGLYRCEVRHLSHFETHPELPLEDFHVVCDDAREPLPAVLELVGGVVSLCAHADERMGRQPGFLAGGELHHSGGIPFLLGGLLCGRQCR